MRSTMSCQSLKAPFLRSSTILPEMPGPMPLRVSSSAWVALFASTAANAGMAVNAVKAVKARAAKIFLNMVFISQVGC